jgi:hypothetical protein
MSPRMKGRAKMRAMIRRKVLPATLVASLVLAGSVAVWAKSKTAPAPDETSEAAADKREDKASDKSDKANLVHISIQTVPPRKAQVRWGRKTLGTIPTPRPLVIERQRDSGPMDLVIHTNGFLTVHTRVYTFSDSRVSVKLTPPTEKNTLFGYRQEPAPNPDAGAPAASPPAPVPALPPQ